LTEEEKDHELDRLRSENARLTDERREADKKWRKDISTDVGNMKRGITDINGKMDSFIRKNEEQDRLLQEHHVSLYGAPGQPGTGVVARQQSTEEKVAHASKIYWLVVSLIVTTVGGAVIAAIIYLPKG